METAVAEGARGLLGANVSTKVRTDNRRRWTKQDQPLTMEVEIEETDIDRIDV
jgi:hypothetical protein